MSISRTVIEQRLDELKQELAEGQRMMREWQNKLANLEQTTLCISGAIQVLEELLAQAPEPAEEGSEVLDST